MSNDKSDEFAVLGLMSALRECELLPRVPDRAKAELAQLQESAWKSGTGCNFVAVYRSTTLISREKDLTQLMNHARVKNARLNITGIMLHYDMNFVQVLEGEEQVVRDLLATISQDDRHARMDIVFTRNGHQRVFRDWSMEMIDLSPQELDAVMSRMPAAGVMSKMVFSTMQARV